jgi:hypothetical protein
MSRKEFELWDIERSCAFVSSVANRTDTNNGASGSAHRRNYIAYSASRV